MKTYLKKIVNNLPSPVMRFLVRCSLVAKQNSLAFSLAINAKLPSSVKMVSISTFGVDLHNDGSSLLRLAYYMGADYIEPGELKLWSDLCEVSDEILEIGGNIGLYTLIGGKSTNGRYTVYEPHPYNFVSLNNNLSYNSVSAICVERAVVSNFGPSEICLNIPLVETGRPSTGAFIDNAEGIDRESYEHFKVKTHSPKDFKFVPDLLKLDVEGAEFEILSSMESFFNEQDTTILVEVRRPSKTEKLRKWIKKFSSTNNYIIVAINNKFPIIPANEILNVVLQDDYDTRDIILLPAHKYDEFCAKGIL